MADTLRPTPLLRFALLGDAAASGATGLLLAAGAGLLAPSLGLPEGLLRIAGFLLLPYAAFVAWIGARTGGAPRNAIRAVVVVNLLWALDSALLLAIGPVSPNGLGVSFVLAQALAVLGFAAMQWTALRGAGPSARAVA